VIDVHLGKIDVHLVLEHGGDDHENDQQHQHHVDHGGDVDVCVDLGSFVSYCDCHFGMLRSPCISHWVGGNQDRERSLKLAPGEKIPAHSHPQIARLRLPDSGSLRDPLLDYRRLLCLMK
jgi:hypothetical protein